MRGCKRFSSIQSSPIITGIDDQSLALSGFGFTFSNDSTASSNSSGFKLMGLVNPTIALLTAATAFLCAAGSDLAASPCGMLSALQQNKGIIKLSLEEVREAKSQQGDWTISELPLPRARCQIRSERIQLSLKIYVLVRIWRKSLSTDCL